MSRGTVKLYYSNGETKDYEPKSMTLSVDADGVAVVTFDDEKTLNALTPNYMQEIFCMLEHLKRDATVKSVVWTAKGRSWCSGAALKGDRTVHVPKDAVKDYAKRKLTHRATDICLKDQTIAFWDFPKPSIAAVQGIAVGGGVNMCLANYHDFVLCADGARFKFPFVKLGLTPELGSSRVFPFIVGFAKAKEMFLLGDWFGAVDAERIGLVNKVVPADKLLDEAVSLARRLAKEPNQQALHLGKQIVNSHLRKDLEKVLDEENKTLMQSIRAMKGGSPLAKM